MVTSAVSTEEYVGGGDDDCKGLFAVLGRIADEELDLEYVYIPMLRECRDQPSPGFSR